MASEYWVAVLLRRPYSLVRKNPRYIASPCGNTPIYPTRTDRAPVSGTKIRMEKSATVTNRAIDPEINNSQSHGDRGAATSAFCSSVPVRAIMDRAASSRVGTIKCAARFPAVLGVSEEINMDLDPARTPNATSDSLSPTTTAVRGSNCNSVAACSIKARFGFLQAQWASGL